MDEAQEMRCEGLVAYQEPRLDVPVERIRGEGGRRDEDLVVVVDARLGMKHRPGAVTRVDGAWVVVDVWTPGTRAVPLEICGEAPCDRVGSGGVASSASVAVPRCLGASVATSTRSRSAVMSECIMGGHLLSKISD